MRSTLATGLAAASCLWLLACAAPAPSNLGVREGRLASCPSSPNCVFTGDSDPGRRTAPFVLALPPERAWPIVVEVVASLDGTEIVEQTDLYLHAQSTTPLMRYVDDLEILMLPEQRQLSVRSASRTGWWDMGANRERVWELRRRLAERGVVTP